MENTSSQYMDRVPPVASLSLSVTMVLKSKAGIGAIWS